MWSDRQILTLTAVVTAIVAVLTVLSTQDWLVTALTIPLVASAAFWSLRLSRRIGQSLQRRYGPSGASQADESASEAPHHQSDRPEHAQRRRHRRRQRGRREG